MLRSDTIVISGIVIVKFQDMYLFWLGTHTSSGYLPVHNWGNQFA